ncbi:MAG: hypothetical protein ABIZ49_02915, partial [Opitutaceae bacterium]
MSAKKSRKSPPAPKPAAQIPAMAAASAGSPAGVPASLAETTPWIESTDPRKRLVGKIAFFAIWIY